MDHVNFDNQDHHTSRTLALLLHLGRSPFLVYQLAIFFAVDMSVH
jgi:hypothetical protein